MIKEFMGIFKPLESPEVIFSESGRWSLHIQGRHDITVAEGQCVDLVIYDEQADCGTLDIKVNCRATLNVVHLVTESSPCQITYTLLDDAVCNVTTLMLAATSLDVKSTLNGANGCFNLNGVFVLTDEQKGSVTVDVGHMVSNCQSHTSFKGVASGNASGKFSGLVYVAQDAQRTDAVQSSRNVTMDNARIETKPQLEIYADDVKCSHGATVGQMDGDAIMYMRQRGLSLADAKRLQIEGFVSDVVLHSSIEEMSEYMQTLLSDKFKML